jgi:hypothetical protein
MLPEPPLAAPEGSSSEPRRPARWADRATAVLLLGAAAAVVVPLVPAVLRAAGIGAPAGQIARAAKLPRLDRPAPPRSEPRFVFDTEGLEEPDPHAFPPRPPSNRPPGDDPHDDADPIRMGIARRDLRLFGDPEPGATVLGDRPAHSLRRRQCRRTHAGRRSRPAAAATRRSHRSSSASASANAGAGSGGERSHRASSASRSCE